MSVKFRMACPVPALPQPFGLEDKVLLLGSCFTENMAQKMEAIHMRTLQNPHGILFNPVSITRALEDYLSGKSYAKEELFELNEAWHSWNHHSRFSDPDPEKALQRINSAIQEAVAFLEQADWLVLTFGSAFVYEIRAEQRPVANCHKAPAGIFERKLYHAEQLIPQVSKVLATIQGRYPKLKLLLTVSPVRHLREGFVENNRSKAELIRMVHALTEQLPAAYYFPSYELVLDDLRDYRFFAEDLVHPNYLATEYVWERFCESCLDTAAVELLPLIREINRAAQHKPFNPDSAAHARFKEQSLQKLNYLRERLPQLDWSQAEQAFL